MTEPVEPQLPSAPPPNGDQRELLKFLREEAEANRKAQRDESDANRKLFLDMSKYVAIPLTFMVAAASIFFYRDVNTMKEDMEAQGKASAQVEIQKMDSHIEDTLQDQFKTETIQSTIQQAAEKATREQAPALIKEVITPEVQSAVASQSGTIREVANRAATDEVKSAIDPVVADVKLQGVIAKANADDARAFDELLASRESGSASQKDLVNGVITNLQRHAPEGIQPDGTYSECANPAGTAYQTVLTSPLVSARKIAIADCIAYMSLGQWVPKVPGDSVSAFTVVESVAPMWMKVALNDPSLSVRAEAIYGINWLFKESYGYGVPNNGFELLDTNFLKQWWTKNSSNQAVIAFISFAYGDSRMLGVNGRLDQIGLYDEAQRLARISPQGSELELLRERMRSVAANMPSTTELAKQMGRGCPEVQQDLGIRLQGFRGKPEQERVDGYALLELQYLSKACSVSQGQLLSEIAAYGVSTRSLGSRYAAVEVVNRTTGMSLDPYDSKPVSEWLKSHSSQP